MKNNILKGMNNPVGSFIKTFMFTFLSAMLVEYKNKNELCADIECLQSILFSAFFASIHVLINWFNPAYTQYGRKHNSKNQKSE